MEQEVSTMDNLDDSENNAKVSDSAYSNSCSNSQSRRSRSSTHSGSHSSRSSGYGGQQSLCGSGGLLNQPSEKRIFKDKDGKKKKLKKCHSNPVPIQADVEFRLPNPAVACEVKEKVSDAVPTSPIIEQVENGVHEDDAIGERKSCVGQDNFEISTSIAPKSPVEIVMSKPNSSDGFSCVISMQDGVVIYSTPSLTKTLGFPKEMWIGRSFIDFIHPSDHSTFASQITSGFATPKKVNLDGAVSGVQSSSTSVSTMFCRIRRYRGLAAGFGVKDRAVSFMPFMLKLSFKNLNDDLGIVLYLVIQATPLFSAFKNAHEIVVNPVPFVMRHVSNGNLEYIDHESVPMLGYLPQDVTGQDVLRLYHPDDLVYVRQLYETIVREGGAPRSKPYRLMAQNGHYLKLETEWSSFINPWSRKLEFVIGKHHVVEGPGNPDVFEAPVRENTSEQEKNKAQGLRDRIVRIMNEVLTKPAEIAKQQMAKRCQELASFMESLMEEPPKIQDELRIELHDNEISYYERDSVMLGGISPHHDYNDGNSSTTTPLSYNQINFNENLQRFFNSHNDMSYDEYQETLCSLTTKDQNTFSGSCMSPMAQQSGDSAEMTSSGESTAVVERSSKPPRLTESLLHKHNSEMEKCLVMQHRECRTSTKEIRERATIDKQKKKDHLARCNATFLPTLDSSIMADSQPHGLKRASKQVEVEAEARSYKHHCGSPRAARRRGPTATPSTSQWPPSSGALNPYVPNMGTSQPMPIMSSMAAVPGLFPLYYVPTSRAPVQSASAVPQETKNTSPFPLPHMQYMMYGQAVFGSPIVVSPLNTQVTCPMQQSTSPCAAHKSLGLDTSNYEQACKPSLLLNPGSNIYGIKLWRETKDGADMVATSSKLNQNSGDSGGICSTSKALNRSGVPVPDSMTSHDIKMKKSEIENTEEPVDRTDEESNYSSFYNSSFFKTESGSAEESGDAKKGVKNGHHVEMNSHSKIARRKREPPWTEHVCVTSELVYKYQILSKNTNEVLDSDKDKIAALQQPSLVNEQLGQLYMEMELEGVAARLTLEEGVTSSSSSGEDSALIVNDVTTKCFKRKREYSKLVMIYEEDAPLPPPCEVTGDLGATETASP